MTGYLRAFVVAAGVSIAIGLRADGTLATTSTPVGVDGRTNATPSVAARGGVVALAWAATKGGATDVFAAISADGGLTFARPVRVNDTPGQANVSGEQAPRVTIVQREGRPPSIVVVWTAKGAAGTRLLSAESGDGGRSFSPAAAVAGSEAKGNRGWESTAVDAHGRVVTVWLDHRALAESSGAPMHHDGQEHTGHGDADGVARAQLSKLYFGRIGDTGSATAIAAGVCYCCKTAIAAAADGAIYAAWRHVYPGNIRDIAFTMSRDGGRTFAPPVRVSDDRWVLDGCPENGPAIAVDAGTVHIVWPTLVKGAGGEPGLALFYATTRDGRTFTPRTQMPTDGTPRHPQIAINDDGRVLVTWDEQLTGSRRVVVDEATVDANGVHFRNLLIMDGGRDDYPVAAAIDHGFVVAYTSATKTESTIRVLRSTDR